MKIYFFSLLLLAQAAAAQPRLSSERVILQTAYGDMTAVLYDDVAPLHAARFLSLARAGAYDGAEIFKIDSKRLVHVAGVDRGRQEIPEDLKAMQHLKPELGGAPHRYGTLTFARDSSDLDPTGTSFAILLTAVPSMDGRFTAFGRVESGLDVLETLRSVPIGSGGHPLERLEIIHAFVIGYPAGSAPPAGAWYFPALLLACGLSMRWQGARAAWRLLSSCGLLIVLAGYFLLFAAYAPWAAQGMWLGALLLVGAIAVFRLMASFESSYAPGNSRLVKETIPPMGSGACP